LFCIKAGTRKASEIHEYFIKLEEILQEVLLEESNELKIQLEKQKNEIILQESILERQKNEIILQEIILEQRKNEIITQESILEQEQPISEQQNETIVQEQPVIEKNYKYFCEDCIYGTNIKQNYDTHISSNKHKKVIENQVKLYICKCSKPYMSYVGYWRHKNECSIFISSK
jgi:hypothetical protein